MVVANNMHEDMHLVIGASGLVGSNLLARLNQIRALSCGTFYENSKPGLLNLDTQNEALVTAFISAIRPKYIYIASSFTNVDGCEENPKKSLAVNVRSVKHIVDAARKFESTIVYFSSDYVFDGTGGPYLPHSICNPINVYGQHKLAAENYVANYSKDWMIVRTCGVFGNDNKNFVARFVKSLQRNQPVKVPTDQFGTPTYALHLANHVIGVVLSPIQIKSTTPKIIHVTNAKSYMSRFDFAKQVARHARIDDDQMIIPVSTAELDQKAVRPMLGGVSHPPEMPTIGVALTQYFSQET